MKKNKKIIVISIFIIFLIICILIIRLMQNKSDEKTCDNLELETLANEINLATDNKFENSLDGNMSNYTPIVFSTETNYIFSYSNESNIEYFIIGESLNENELFDLKSFVKTNNELYPDKQIKMETHGEYTYVISSEEYTSVIEGIIRSYIYCN